MPALAWPGKGCLCLVSSIPKKPSLFVQIHCGQFGRQSAWLHTVCSSAVCQLSIQSAPLCQHTCAAGHATSSAPFGIALKIKRLWHPVVKHPWTLLYTLLWNDLLAIRLGFARSISVVSFVYQYSPVLAYGEWWDSAVSFARSVAGNCC